MKPLLLHHEIPWTEEGDGDGRREKQTDVRGSGVEDKGRGLVTWASNRLAFPFLPLRHNGSH